MLKSTRSCLNLNVWSLNANYFFMNNTYFLWIIYISNLLLLKRTFCWLVSTLSGFTQDPKGTREHPHVEKPIWKTQVQICRPRRAQRAPDWSSRHCDLLELTIGTVPGVSPLFCFFFFWGKIGKHMETSCCCFHIFRGVLRCFSGKLVIWLACVMT